MSEIAVQSSAVLKCVVSSCHDVLRFTKPALGINHILMALIPIFFGGIKKKKIQI